MLIPLAVAALTPRLAGPTTDYIAQRKIDTALRGQTIQAQACRVRGDFHFDRALLIAQFKTRLAVPGPAGVCELQSALLALGYSPGQIDGKTGPNTKLAAEAFAIRWGLPPSAVNTPVFFNMVARALTGEQPTH